MDITYIPIARGFVYLTAVVDCYSPVLEAVEKAIERFGRPDILNADQDSQFTSLAFAGLLKENGIQISMDGRGSWRDTVFVERLW